MIVTDANVRVCAYRAEAVHHESCRRPMQMVADGDQSFALSGVVPSGFVRVVTDPRIVRPPSPIDHALGLAEDLLGQPSRIMIRSGLRHRGLFARLCRESGAKGDLGPAASRAALAPSWL